MADTMVLPVKIIMSPTSSSRPLAGRNTRSAALRTKTLLLLTARRRAQGREGYATPYRSLTREPSPLLAQTGQQDDVDAPSALQISGFEQALLLETEPLREPLR